MEKDDARYLSLGQLHDQGSSSAAHKLARLIYTMLTRGEEYTDQELLGGVS